jgi:hypothetical protein
MLLAIIVMVSVGAPASHAVSSTDKRVKVPILLAISADRTFIEPIAGSDNFRIRMTGTKDRITWFTDRPARRTGVMRGDELIASWARIGFGQVPPNAALTLRVDQQASTFIVEATKPRYANGVLAFTVRPLGVLKTTLPLVSHTADLFLDDVEVWIPSDPSTSLTHFWNFGDGVGS